jgi:hypothetical protein
MDLSNINTELKDYLAVVPIRIQFDHQISPRLGGGEEGDYIQTFEGTVYTGEDYGRLNLVAGRIRAIKLDIECAIADDDSLLDIFDFSSELDGFSFLLDGHSITMRFCEDDTFNFDTFYMGQPILILQYLGIKPEFRNKSLGLAAMKAVIEHIGVGCGLVALLACPLQFVERSNDRSRQRDDDLELINFKGDRESATEKLIEYYGKLGFIRVDDTAYMVRLR